jgi:hypothetical protein
VLAVFVAVGEDVGDAPLCCNVQGARFLELSCDFEDADTGVGHEFCQFSSCGEDGALGVVEFMTWEGGCGGVTVLQVFLLRFFGFAGPF